MPLHPNQQAPYTSASAVVSFLDRYRAATLPPKIQHDDLKRIGVKDSLLKRTMSSLRLLELVEDDGTPTTALERLLGARPDEYQDAVASHLRLVYADVFAILDPATASAAEMQNAFWGYEPKGQLDAIIRLFVGLCQYAGIVHEEARPPIPSAKPRRTNGTGGDPPQRGKRGGTGATSRPGSNASRSEAPSPVGLLFGFTESDVAALSDDEFNEVWAALGKVARARATRSSSALGSPPTDEEDEI